ncbi:MAG: hypothetical protein MZW92_16405 [Comamonadaceae bacterium]|nr:hypothetical protein [Comamonadaceae bacterium]
MRTAGWSRAPSQLLAGSRWLAGLSLVLAGAAACRAGDRRAAGTARAHGRVRGSAAGRGGGLPCPARGDGS